MWIGATTITLLASHNDMRRVLLRFIDRLMHVAKKIGTPCGSLPIPKRGAMSTLAWYRHQPQLLRKATDVASVCALLFIRAKRVSNQDHPITE